MRVVPSALDMDIEIPMSRRSPRGGMCFKTTMTIRRPAAPVTSSSMETRDISQMTAAASGMRIDVPVRTRRSLIGASRIPAVCRREMFMAADRPLELPIMKTAHSGKSIWVLCYPARLPGTSFSPISQRRTGRDSNWDAPTLSPPTPRKHSSVPTSPAAVRVVLLIAIGIRTASTSARPISVSGRMGHST